MMPVGFPNFLLVMFYEDAFQAGMKFMAEAFRPFERGDARLDMPVPASLRPANTTDWPS